MLEKISWIKQNEQTHAFATAVKKCDFETRGYVEDEYVFWGTANVYEKRGGVRRIRFADAPYCNRFFVRRPKRIEDFSGNIVVEILNSTSGFDIDRVWVLCREQFMRNGDIYIGITSKPNAAASLQRFDIVRYKELNWKNPLKYDMDPAQVGNLAKNGMPSSLETEDGLFWDMLRDVVKLIQSDEEKNPILAYLNQPSYTYLSGWSQSGGYMIRYIQDFSQDNLFDGYFSCGTVSHCTPSLNQEDSVDPSPESKQLSMLDKPMIEMHTECDNASWGNQIARQNSDKWFRVFDIVGPSHDTTTSMEEYYQEDEDLLLLGVDFKMYQGKNKYPNSFPYEYAYQAAFVHLCRWVRDGVEPLRQEPILVDPSTMKNVTDIHGNAIGGWRLPLINYPLCKFCPTSMALTPDGEFSCSLYGHEEPYSLETLKVLYGDADKYGELIRKDAMNCIDAGLLLIEDVDSLVMRGIWTAKKFGL